MMRMKCAVLMIAVILVSSHFPFPTTANESISKSWVGIDVPSLSSRKIVIVNKKRLRTIPISGRGAGRTKSKSSAGRHHTSLLRLYFVIIFSAFFAFFSF